MDHTGPIVLGVCAGVGMLEEAVRLIFPGARTACLCEWESYAAAVLLARMEEKSMEPTPIWCGDLRSFDAAPFRGLVDLFIGGLPCQPYSAAGKREGNEDKRSWGGEGPVAQAVRIISECRPTVVFFENVSAWVRSDDQWFRPFGDELSRLGYTLVEPVFISASDVKASHERERVFILAYAESARGGGLAKRQWRNWQRALNPNWRSTELVQPESGGQRELRKPPAGSGQLECSQSAMADPVSERLQGHAGHGDTGDQPGWQRPGEARSVGESSAAVADASSTGQQEWGSLTGNAESKCQTPKRSSDSLVFAPGPSERHIWERFIEDTPYLAPAVEPGFRMLVDGMAYVVDQSRADQLRCSGNGVVAIQGALALAILLKRAGLIVTSG